MSFGNIFFAGGGGGFLYSQFFTVKVGHLQYKTVTHPLYFM